MSIAKTKCDFCGKILVLALVLMVISICVSSTVYIYLYILQNNPVIIPPIIRGDQLTPNISTYVYMYTRLYCIYCTEEYSIPSQLFSSLYAVHLYVRYKGFHPRVSSSHSEGNSIIPECHPAILKAIQSS